MKRLFFILTLALVIVFMGKKLLPGNEMFDFHDETQPARIQQFALNLRNGVLPPRMAPDFVFRLGYPVFNFYAPSSYWLTTAIHLLGFDVADSLKLSFLAALLIAFTGMFRYLRRFLTHYGSLLGAAIYVSSPYMAVEIFIRGNLGEVWFLAILPWALYLLHLNSEKRSRGVFLALIASLAFGLTVHNILSLLFLPLVLGYALLLKERRRNILGIVLALLLSAYFLVPAVMENRLTYAQQIAKSTNYKAHFLCWHQLWTAPYWGYGGSVEGCTDDGMSFKLGKPQLVLAGLGVLLFLTRQLFGKKHRDQNGRLLALILAGTLVSLYLTTYQSAFIWDLLAPVLGLFQFPWRFLVFGLFGMSVFGGYLFGTKQNKLAYILAVLSIAGIIFISGKYFTKYMQPKDKFMGYISKEYVEYLVAYKVAEYLPKNVDYDYFLYLEPKGTGPYRKDPRLGSPVFALDKKPVRTVVDDPFYKEAETESRSFIVNVQYFPYWELSLNGREVIPDRFDRLGRPLLESDSPNTAVRARYRETPVERLGNLVTLVAIAALLYIIANRKLWKKPSTKKN